MPLGVYQPLGLAEFMNSVLMSYLPLLYCAAICQKKGQYKKQFAPLKGLEMSIPLQVGTPLLHVPSAVHVIVTELSDAGSLIA